jgi:hypothetical protein
MYAKEIKEEVWAQMKRALIIDGKYLLSDDMIHTSFIDRDIVFGENVALLEGITSVKIPNRYW